MKIRFLDDDPNPPKEGEYLRKQDGSLYRVESFVADQTLLPKTAGMAELAPVESIPEGASVRSFLYAAKNTF